MSEVEGYMQISVTEPYEVPSCESNDNVKMLRRGGVQIHVVARRVGRERDFREWFLD